MKISKLLAILAIFCTSAFGQVVTAPMPSPRFQVFTSAGLPLAGGCLFSYQAGTSNPLATYKDNLGVAQNSNPVLLDSTGSSDVWLGPSKYKLQLFSAGGVNCASGSLLWTRDGVYGPNLPVTTTLALIAQTAPSCVAANYTIWADSSATRFKMCNNGTADVVVGAATTDTLTNKTLSSPTINTPSIVGGTMSGTIAAQGTFSGNPVFSGNPTFTGTTVTKNLNNIQFADQFSGADACAKINAAILALPTTGGTVFAQGFQGNQTCASNPFAGAPVSGSLYLGNATFTTSAQWVLPDKWSIYGNGRGDPGANGTTIQAAPGYASAATGVIRIGPGTTFAHGIVIDNLTVDCNSVASSIGIYTAGAADGSGLRRLDIANCPVAGARFDGTQTQYYFIEGVEVYPQAAATATTDGIEFINGTFPGNVSRVTATGTVSQMIRSAIYLDNVNGGNFLLPHGEYVVSTVLAGDVNQVNGVNIIGPSGSSNGPVTNVVKISNVATSQNITILGWQKNGATNGVVNLINSRTWTDNGCAFWSYGDGGAPRPEISSCTGQVSLLPGSAMLGNLNMNGFTLSDGGTGSIPVSGDMSFGTGLSNNAAGFKHKRGTAGCATAASVGAACTTTVTWTTTFADANYTVSCMGDAVTSGIPVNGGITAKLAASVTFQTVATTAAAAQYTNIECVAVHD